MTKRSNTARKLKLEPAAPLRLDLGCGPNKQPGFHGVDAIEFVGVDTVQDLRNAPWPWKDGTVEHVHCSHFLEHLSQIDRVIFANELYRILKPGGTAFVVTPHYGSERAYGDPSHQWPPVTGFGYMYWNKAWRDVNAPHTDAAVLAKSGRQLDRRVTGFSCDFDWQGGFTLHGTVQTWNQERQQYATLWYREAAQDMFITLTKAIRQ